MEYFTVMKFADIFTVPTVQYRVSRVFRGPIIKTVDPDKKRS